jgi:hypothetical protein
MEPSRAIQIYEQQYTQWSQRWCYQWSSPMLTFPIDAVPVLGRIISGYFHPDTPEGTADVVPPPVHNEPHWEDRMLRGYQWTMSLQMVAESIWWGDAIVGTDGSAANGHGTCSFVILTNIVSEPPTVSVKCRGNLPNLAEYIDMDSHHPEAAALFSALCFVHFLLTKYPRGPTTGNVPWLHFVLDNKSIAEDNWVEIWPRNFSVRLSQVWLWPTSRNPTRNWITSSCIEHQIGQRAPRSTQTEKQTTTWSQSKLHCRWCLYRYPPLTP